MTRQEANEKILANLIKIVAENPDLRFNQILRGLSINPSKDFYEESEATLNGTDWEAFNGTA